MYYQLFNFKKLGFRSRSKLTTGKKQFDLENVTTATSKRRVHAVLQYKTVIQFGIATSMLPKTSF
ncbi:hypothetical protein BDF20DRAFT_884990 [Mycotypha africana]|uniref:uncharacterized protein n=1 Tax=Mycotypha africana TaxID=64632 RepID=UPI002300E1F7|nr:uncharacterized protein BDF20DRAFT_884990 [Mycotypha africana]KAI8971533.1 hypothetical protein BDF20DRAFT_884990 [Mycotypha africana]